MTKPKLDPATLRACARAIERRAELLHRVHERKGWSQNHHFMHRAAELEFMADVVRGLRIYSPKRPTKARKASK